MKRPKIIEPRTAWTGSAIDLGIFEDVFQLLFCRVLIEAGQLLCGFPDPDCVLQTRLVSGSPEALLSLVHLTAGFIDLADQITESGGAQEGLESLAGEWQVRYRFREMIHDFPRLRTLAPFGQRDSALGLNFQPDLADVRAPFLAWEKTVVKERVGFLKFSRLG